MSQRIRTLTGLGQFKDQRATLQ